MPYERYDLGGVRLEMYQLIHLQRMMICDYVGPVCAVATAITG